jgi:hypothetical protein
VLDSILEIGPQHPNRSSGLLLEPSKLIGSQIQPSSSKTEATNLQDPAVVHRELLQSSIPAAQVAEAAE